MITASCPLLSTWNCVPDHPGSSILKTAPLIIGAQNPYSHSTIKAEIGLIFLKP
jgi:hypothetical protein